MNDEQYSELAAACDALLRRPESDLAWLAHPLLHVMSEHPVHLAAYAPLFERLGWERGDARWWSQSGSRVYRAGSLMKRFTRAAAAKPIADVASDGAVDTPVILVSWLVHPDHAAQEDDFYFGPLQRSLESRGIRSLLLLRNQTGLPWTSLSEAVARSGYRGRVLLPDVAPAGDEWTALGAQFAARKRFDTTKRLQEPELTPVLATWLRDQWPSTLASENLVLASQIEAICRRCRPKIVVTLFEGHSWERCVWAAARAVDPRVTCAGYQHTVIRRRAHAVMRAIGHGKGWDPDLILAAGETTRRRFSQSADLGSVPIVSIGTHRRPPMTAQRPSNRDAVLVIPEGLDAECEHLFTFALEAARRDVARPFVLRMHPVLSFDRVAARLPPRSAWPPKVEISDRQRIEDDFSRCGACLYRGSSAALHAVLAGLKPHYVARADELTIDPMDDVPAWRTVVGEPEAFVRSLSATEAAPAEDRQRAWSQAAAYCSGYMQPFDDSQVDAILALAGLTSSHLSRVSQRPA
jgi:hypothetical protein